MKGKRFTSGISLTTKIISALLFASIIDITSFAQSSQKEINEQVWKPFIRSFSEGDTDGFMNLHSKDLIRSARESGKVLNWDQYYKQTSNGNERGKKDKITMTIELRFTERVSNDTQAIDVGVYKTSWKMANGEQGVGYGRFHVALRKESGTWKILLDTDSDEKGTINEASFLSAPLLLQ